jgi:hypothetical protein
MTIPTPRAHDLTDRSEGKHAQHFATALGAVCRAADATRSAA